MTHLVWIVLGLGLGMIQTTLLPHLGIRYAFDVTVAFIVYLSLFRSPREGIPLFLFLGWFADSLSGGPFGTHLVTYLWLYIGGRWIISIIHNKNITLLILIVPVGIILQNLIGLWALALSHQEGSIMLPPAAVVANQLLWALLGGPLLIGLFRWIGHKWDRFDTRRRTAKKDTRTYAETRVSY